jgi:hypothetical protein
MWLGRNNKNEYMNKTGSANGQIIIPFSILPRVLPGYQFIFIPLGRSS